MAALTPLWRNSLRTWLAASLAIGVMLWAGRSGVLVLALAMAVVFINENDLVPARTVSQQVGGALIGILTAVVLHQISSGWLVLAIGLLVTGVLVRGLGLPKGVGMGYIGCWSLEVIGYGKHFNWALIFDLAFAVVVGIAAALVATWVFWPRRPLQELPALDARLARQFSQQVEQLRRWLIDGGEAPAPLSSQALLPQILLLQQLREQGRGGSASRLQRRLTARWAQTGAIWRQLLRQWKLLEPLLLQLKAPLPPSSHQRLLLNTLETIALGLSSAEPGPRDRPSAPGRWIAEAEALQAPKPLLLAIAQQSEQLQDLLHSRRLLQEAIQRMGRAA